MNASSDLRALDALLERCAPERVVVITGAGMSAESGIPTFRGKEGYWTVGAKEYHPQELATLAAYRQLAREVWHWYLYRRSVCRAAAPNPAHFALAELERKLGDRFTLVSQNVDGLHLIAGNSHARTLEVHGNIDYMRVHEDGSAAEPIPIPAAMPMLGKTDPLTDELWALLRDVRGRPTRPHILWFDEYYDERLYRAESALQAARECELVVVIGTSGAAAIPWHATAEALNHGASLLVIDPEQGPFAEHVLQPKMAQRGLWLRGGAVEWVPALVERLQ
ncbi:SIR2 family NAD-dependent protein deacylase [Nannocystaceae bacterium ST9]